MDLWLSGLPTSHRRQEVGEVAGSRRLNRLDLAKWIVHPENPLTARAFANRLVGSSLAPSAGGLAFRDVTALVLPTGLGASDMSSTTRPLGRPK